MLEIFYFLIKWLLEKTKKILQVIYDSDFKNFECIIIDNYNKNEIKSLNTQIKIVSPKIDLNRFLNNEDPIKRIEEIYEISDPNKDLNTLFIFPVNKLIVNFILAKKNPTNQSFVFILVLYYTT